MSVLVTSTARSNRPLPPPPAVQAKTAAPPRTQKVDHELPPKAPEPIKEPRLDPPFIEPFVAWSWDPTGIGFLDAIIDVLAKIILSPALLIMGVVDLFGAKTLNHALNAQRLNTLRDFENGMRLLRSSTGSEVTKAMARLTADGSLINFTRELSHEQRLEFWGLVVSKLDNPKAAAVLITHLIKQAASPDLIDRMAARLYATGQLAETQRWVTAMHPDEIRFTSFGQFVDMTLPKPLLIAHRGAIPGDYVENSIPAFDAAMKAGADGIEIDLAVTKDGKVVISHDEDPDSLVALARQANLEPGSQYIPVPPQIGSPMRKPIRELTLKEFKAFYGFKKPGGEVIHPQPTAMEVGDWARQQDPAKLKRIVLDTKLLDWATDAQIKAYADGLREAFSSPGLAERCVVMCTVPRVLAALKQQLGPRFKYTLDVEIVSIKPDPQDVTGLDAGRKDGNAFTSMGLPRIGVDARDTFMQVLYDRRGRWGSDPAERPSFMGWTVNTENDMRDIIGSGLGDEMLTDDVPALLKVRRRLFPDETPVVQTQLIDKFEH